jgi:PPOX class probable F420-dependent enzyme
MMKAVPESHRDLLRSDVRALAYLGTTMADGSPQVTPLWFDVEGEMIRINTARGRTKARNMAARPRVALAIADPADPYRYLQIRGTVIEMREQGAVEHIRLLSRKYRDTDDFPVPAEQVRVMVLIRPDHVSAKA